VKLTLSSGTKFLVMINKIIIAIHPDF
jgi:hypothetical protein